MKINASRRSGFTLIELSIVLIIVGLIIGAVLAGQELIKSAEIRGIISQLDRYTTAVDAFRLKYNATPGDFQYGSTLLPIVNGITGSNGDGNGLLFTSATGAAAKWDVEMFYFWQHLGLLGVVEFVYTGAAAPIINTNIPSLKNNRGGIVAYTSSDGNNYFQLGIANSTTTVANNASVTGINNPFAPDGAYNLDNKLDDGVPSTGKVVAINGTFDTPISVAGDVGTAKCASALTSYNILNNPGYVCSLRYKAQF